MALPPGSRVGAYEILAPLGRGGIGEVYRARDRKLDRDVAIKALPELFVEDRDRLARFEREARMLASLNHPNIGAIYGLEDQDGAKFLILELVEGQTLAEKLAAGPLPIEDALSVAGQIASALEAAHGAGIIHRDLKPSNIQIRSDGSVKVLDLGLARNVEQGRTAVDSSFSPTMTTPATLAGVVLGTAAYMSPEQARGKPLDKRTDIFSFACVLYECLTGKQAFYGETVSDTISAILRSEPDTAALPRETPGRIRVLLRRCFQKDPKRRLHDIADARIEIDEAQTTGGEEPPAAPMPAPSRRVLWGIGGALAGAALAAAALLLGRHAPEVRPSGVGIHAVLPLPAGERLWTERLSLALSPDGRTVVFTAVGNGTQRLFRRPLGGSDAEPIQGSEGASRPFFSPDGQWVGFLLRNELRKVPLAGGTAIRICHLPPATGAVSWGPDGRMVTTFGTNRGLYTVSETGGLPQTLTEVDASRGEHAHLYPQILPGGRTVLFTVRLGKDYTDVEKSNIAVLDLAGGKWATILEGASYARYGGGRLVFVRGPSVFWVPFDLSRLAVTGPAVALTENIAVDMDEGTAQLALSNDGTLAYADGGALRAPGTAVLRLDRAGRESVLPLPAATYSSPRLSPDGKRLALVQRIGSRRSIVVYDRERGILSSPTPEPGESLAPFWSPDGKRIAFSRITSSVPQLSVRSADGTGEIEALTAPSADAQFPLAWSPDEQILYSVFYTKDYSPTRQLLTSDIWLLRPARDVPPRPWLESAFSESGASLSPDGKWVTYVSDESGTSEVYVRPFPGPGAAVRVSTGSGGETTWSRDGREILYRVGAGLPKFMAADVRTSPALEISAPRLLFTAELNSGGPSVRANEFREYDVSRDGNEIIGLRTIRKDEPPRQIVIETGFASPGT